MLLNLKIVLMERLFRHYAGHTSFNKMPKQFVWSIIYSSQ